MILLIPLKMHPAAPAQLPFAEDPEPKFFHAINFSDGLADNCLDSYIALAEARFGDLDAALAKIDHMSNLRMRAESLRKVAEVVVERTKRSRE